MLIQSNRFKYSIKSLCLIFLENLQSLKKLDAVLMG